MQSLGFAVDCLTTVITDTVKYIKQKQVILVWREKGGGREKTITENHKAITEIWRLIAYLVKLIIIITFPGVRKYLWLFLLKISSLLFVQPLIMVDKMVGEGRSQLKKVYTWVDNYLCGWWVHGDPMYYCFCFWRPSEMSILNM